ncbi:uncharacterized protein BO66DRAFT_38780 [Aspergillus aculeatinus CBS 121060]|uniref:Uncharacterized protein n=1 Tax=Aspergillus aculeatinus CBS 121060 TaxID=1448322 RepID=A0ACD1HFF5_9EURO|nr:hypothetical protein BO66DRAFT_38780 [Aspergillus aculeatinus CBS 121060]RAH72145.1 hypothetical protein BO66DRAFT_38780 [Aspergillus aculeatinus CBS 121060]
MDWILSLALEARLDLLAPCYLAGTAKMHCSSVFCHLWLGWCRDRLRFARHGYSCHWQKWGVHLRPVITHMSCVFTSFSFLPSGRCRWSVQLQIVVVLYICIGRGRFWAVVATPNPRSIARSGRTLADRGCGMIVFGIHHVPCSFYTFHHDGGGLYLHRARPWTADTVRRWKGMLPHLR